MRNYAKDVLIVNGSNIKTIKLSSAVNRLNFFCLINYIHDISKQKIAYKRLFQCILIKGI